MDALYVSQHDPFSHRVFLFDHYDICRPERSIVKDLTGIQFVAWLETQLGDLVEQLDTETLDQTDPNQKGAFLISSQNVATWPLATLNIWFRQIVNGVAMPRMRWPIQVVVRSAPL